MHSRRTRKEQLVVDEASRATFDWYVQYRTAYAFIGEEAYELFPPQITRKVWNDTALWFSKTVGSQGEVYAFEPEPNNFAKLKTNIERNNITNVIPLQMALSETEGRTQIVGRGGVTAITQRSTNTTIEATTIDVNVIRALGHSIKNF